MSPKMTLLSGYVDCDLLTTFKSSCSKLTDHELLKRLTGNKLLTSRTVRVNNQVYL